MGPYVQLSRVWRVGMKAHLQSWLDESGVGTRTPGYAARVRRADRAQAAAAKAELRRQMERALAACSSCCLDDENDVQTVLNALFGPTRSKK